MQGSVRLATTLVLSMSLGATATAAVNPKQTAPQVTPEDTRKILRTAPQLAPAAQEQPGPPYSLTISGGISLGAYEAGLNWVLTEWLKTKQPRWQKSTQPSGPLMGVTGASAGAINALFTAIRWCEASPDTSVDNNLFSTTWRSVGLDTLLPSSTDGYHGLADPAADPDFLFSRKQAFTGVLQELARRLGPATTPATYLSGCEIPVGLMVTKAHPRTIQIEGLRTKSQRFVVPLVAREDNGQLRFFLNSGIIDDARYQNLLGNMLWLRHGPDRQQVETRDVLAAVQASAAHPSSFGPVELGYCAEAGECPRSRQTPDAQCKALGQRLAGRHNGNGNGNGGEMVLCHEPFVDGGAFDNVPVGVAMAQVESRLFPTVTGSTPPSLPVRYLYMDPGIRRELPSAKRFPGVCSEDAVSAAAAGAEQRPSRDPIAELGTFVGGMYASARDYELHNVLRYNDWNLTARRLTRQTLDLTARACQSPSPPATCSAAGGPLDTQLDESLRKEADDVEKLESLGAVTEWGSARKQLFARLKDRLDALQASKEPLVVGARAQLAATMNRLGHTSPAGRRLEIPTRFAPITGDMISHFAAFIDRPFRDYDYYAGIYDGLYSATSWDCGKCEWDEQKLRMNRLLSDLRIKETGVGATNGAVAIYDRLLQMESAVREPPASAGVSASQPTTDKVMPASVQVLEAITAQQRCEQGGAPQGFCLADCRFSSFTAALPAEYRPEPVLAATMLAEGSRWWTVPAVRLADRLEVLQSQRNEQPDVSNGPGAKVLQVLGPVASLATHHAWYETADSWWFAPHSSASHPLLRVLAPHLVLSTSSDRAVSLGLLHYGLRTGALDAEGANRLALLGDLSLRAGFRPRPEDDDIAAIFSDRSIVALDVAGGPAFRFRNPWFNSLQLRAGLSLPSPNEPIYGRHAELAATFVQGLLRFALGCQTREIPLDAGCRDELYLSVGLNDLPGLIQHLLF